MITELQSLRDRAQRRHRLAFTLLVTSALAFVGAMSSESSVLIAITTLATVAACWWAERTKAEVNMARESLSAAVMIASLIDARRDH